MGLGQRIGASGTAVVKTPYKRHVFLCVLAWLLFLVFCCLLFFGLFFLLLFCCFVFFVGKKKTDVAIC